MALGFYLVVVAITPLGLGPDLNLLVAHRAGRVVGGAAAGGLLSADRIFHNDYEDGALDVLMTGPLPLAARRRDQEPRPLAHDTGVPLALLAPVLGLLLNLPLRQVRCSCSRCSPARPR